MSCSEARAKGYVTTIYGRRRYVDLAHGQPHERAAAERQAVNSIVQVLHKHSPVRFMRAIS